MIGMMRRPFAALVFAGLLAAAPHGGLASRTDETVIGDNQSYMQDRYAALPGPWSTWLDRSITDRSNSIRIRKSVFPRDTFIQWRFPDKVASTGVYGYNYVAYGQYWTLKPPVEVPPKKLRDIEALTLFPAVRFTGDGSRFNVLAEFFVTRRPGDIGSRSAEIGWLLNTPPATLTYFRSGKQIGVFKDRFSQEWLVASHNDGAAGLYIKFVPKDLAPHLRAPLDAKGSLKWLIDRRVIAADSYFNGAAVGIEPLMGKGSATIDNFTVDYR